MDLSVFFGAFLGFAAGLITQGVGTWWRRREVRKLHRNLIVVELMDNLSTIHAMLEGLERTISGGYRVAEMVVSRPRSNALRSTINASETLLALPSEERTAIVQLVGQVEHAISEYENWPRVVTGPNASDRVRLSNGQEQTISEFMTEQLRVTLREVLRTHMGVLATILNNSKDADLTPRELVRVRTALEPTRKRWGKSKALDIALESPDPEELDTTQHEVLIAWTHGRSDYPIPVVEMKPLVLKKERGE